MLMKCLNELFPATKGRSQVKPTCVQMSTGPGMKSPRLPEKTPFELQRQLATSCRCALGSSAMSKGPCGQNQGLASFEVHKLVQQSKTLFPIEPKYAQTGRHLLYKSHKATEQSQFEQIPVLPLKSRTRPDPRPEAGMQFEHFHRLTRRN